MQLTSKTALITGASSGIGEALSHELIACGMKVIGIARDEQKLSKVAKKCGASFTPFRADVGNYAEIEALFQFIKK